MVTYTEELNRICHQQLKQLYRGTWAIDQIPSKIERDAFCFILNLDASNMPGSHWVAVFFPPSTSDIHHRIALFIDPLGWPHHLLNPALRKYFADCNVKTVPFAIQGWTSKNCGQFCAYILSMLPRNHFDLHHMLETTFSPTDLSNNDSIVKRWWNSI